MAARISSRPALWRQISFGYPEGAFCDRVASVPPRHLRIRVFARYAHLPDRLAWETFEARNGYSRRSDK